MVPEAGLEPRPGGAAYARPVASTVVAWIGAMLRCLGDACTESQREDAHPGPHRAHRHASPKMVAKRSMKLFLPLAAVFVVSSTLAYALNHSVVGASTNSSEPAQASVALAVVTSQELFGDPQLYALDSCLTAWSYVSAERPEIYPAGLEQFIDSGCGAPSVPSPILRIEHQR